jgi:hypothetical protein
MSNTDAEAKPVRSEVASQNEIETRNDLRLAQLGLRLLGVMFLVEGAAAIISGAGHAFLTAKDYAKGGYDYSGDPYSVAILASGVTLFLAGFYFVIDGRWVLRNVFDSASDQQAIVNPEVPD